MTMHKILKNLLYITWFVFMCGLAIAGFGEQIVGIFSPSSVPKTTYHTTNQPFSWEQVEVRTREEFDALDPGRQELLILLNQGIEFTDKQAAWLVARTNHQAAQAEPTPEPTPTPLPKERWVGGRKFILTDIGTYIVAPK